nr:MAG TPA: hypothetical protein [Caudoviricetes sp.]
MNSQSAFLWKELVKKNIGSYRNFIKDVTFVMISPINENYLIHTKLDSGKDYQVELHKDIVHFFLESQKTAYSELILDRYMNFEEFITDYKLYEEHIKQTEKAINDDEKEY